MPCATHQAACGCIDLPRGCSHGCRWCKGCKCTKAQAPVVRRAAVAAAPAPAPAIQSAGMSATRGGVRQRTDSELGHGKRGAAGSPHRLGTIDVESQPRRWERCRPAVPWPMNRSDSRCVWGRAHTGHMFILFDCFVLFWCFVLFCSCLGGRESCTIESSSHSVKQPQTFAKWVRGERAPKGAHVFGCKGSHSWLAGRGTQVQVHPRTRTRTRCVVGLKQRPRRLWWPRRVTLA